jgi:hypothetical protein
MVGSAIPAESPGRWKFHLSTVRFRTSSARPQDSLSSFTSALIKPASVCH